MWIHALKMLFKCKFWFHRSNMECVIQFPYRVSKWNPTCLWGHFEHLSCQMISITTPLALPLNFSIYIYMNNPVFQSPLNISSHILSLKYSILIPLWTFFKISSLGVSPPSFRYFLASVYCVTSNYRPNFVFMADFIPVGQGWYVSCPLYPLYLVGQLIGKRCQCRLAEWVNQTWAWISEFKFILSR